MLSRFLAFVTPPVRSAPCSPASSAWRSSRKPRTLPLSGVAPSRPDLVGGTAWLNSEKPINLADLKGRIVVLDFWTLCCINCIHTLPDLAKIEERYPGMVVVIGVHSPKFEREKNTESIRKAILRYEITHPVVNDADHKIWNAYGVNSGPLSLIDPTATLWSRRGRETSSWWSCTSRKIIKEFEGKGLKKTPSNSN